MSVKLCYVRITFLSSILPHDLTELQKGKKPKPYQLRSTENTLESSDYESETITEKHTAIEAESIDSFLRSPLHLEKRDLLQTEIFIQIYSDTCSLLSVEFLSLIIN